MHRIARFRSCLRACPRLCGLAGLLVLAVACGGGREGNGRSVVLIVVDTLRADHLGTYGSARPTSPALDRYAESGALFERAVAASPWTLPSFATLYTGQLPSRHGAGRRLRGEGRRRVGALDPSLPVLAELLRSRGYQTAAVVSNPFLRESFGVGRGFETYDHSPANRWKLRRAREVVTSALAWLERRDARPFFLVVHFFDPHLNYDPVPSVRGRFTGGYQGQLRLPIDQLREFRRGSIALDDRDREFVRAAYDEELLAVDQELDRLLSSLAEGELLDRVVIVFTSDHGEEFFEHGSFEHGHTAYQELLGVPLVFWGPGVEPGRIDTPVSHLDVFPTLLDALDLPVPEGLPGVSLWPRMTRGDAVPARDIVAEGTLYGPQRQALLRWPWKLIHTHRQDRLELFDLGQDPGEQADLAAELPELVEEMRGELGGWVASAAAGRQQAVEAEIDQETREQLKSLGYLE